MSWDLFSAAEAASRPPAPPRAARRPSNEELGHQVAATRGGRAVAQPLADVGDWTVSAVNGAMREMVEAVFPPLWVVGEITNFTRARSGHCYFTLRDETSQLRCVMWRDEARRLPTSPSEGMEVRVLGRLSLYEPRGEYQLVVSVLEGRGDGLWKLALDRLRLKLEAEGLTAPTRKRPLPRYPAAIGVVTSPSGAVLHDIANVVRRPDGSHVAFDANPLHDWAKAAGSIYQAELQRLLSLHLGLEWGPERNGCREPVGFSAEQLRAFSKRTVAIEAELERSGATYESAAERMRADDDASLATRPRKDHSLTPALLAKRWEAEARAVGLGSAAAVETAVVGRRTRPVQLTSDEVVAGLLDPDTGLCANDARFTEAKVVERICAASAGRLTTEQILGLAEDFLASEHVVRLVPESAGARRRPPEWSTLVHRRLENTVLERLARLVEQTCEETGYERVHVVGHSLGGAVARYYVQRMGGDARVHTLCTLGSPHAGTLAAHLLPSRLVRQLRPDSALMQELAAPSPGCRTRFVAFWSDL
ncbi:MAG: exodeoxyribonuclease VII large subunit, partial [Gemmatimonadetes bacterium]|nr:exodeoxyribonuclease VII large subunit [Gemmatimonadota bacterium]